MYSNKIKTIQFGFIETIQFSYFKTIQFLDKMINNCIVLVDNCTVLTENYTVLIFCNQPNCINRNMLFLFNGNDSHDYEKQICI